MMPILAIGKDESGYTLIEMLAVLIIIGIIGLLVYPSLVTGEEKTEIKYIGALLKADLQQAREEAIAGKTEVIFNFEPKGYYFELGDLEIRRTFPKYQFEFQIPEEGESLDEDGSGLKITAEGKLPKKTIIWQTTHFTGDITINEDGFETWNVTSK